MRKITKEYIDKIIGLRNIERLDDYIRANLPIRWKCSICNYIWKTTWNSIQQNHGCTKCKKKINANKQKLTNNKIDSYILNNNIKRVDDYIGRSDTKMKWLCLICNNIWEAVWDSIKQKRGCPKCGIKIRTNKLRLKNADLDNYISITKLNIKRLDNYPGRSNLKMSWQCLKCNHVWQKSWNKIKISGKCPMCDSKISRGEKAIIELLHQHNIDFIFQTQIKLNNRKLIIDFIIIKSNLFIEFNGRQHYEPVKFSSHMTNKTAKIILSKQKQRDKFLRKYCKENNINLLEINGKPFQYSTYIKQKEKIEELLKINKILI